MRIASLIVLLMKVEKRNYVLTVSLHNFNNFFLSISYLAICHHSVDKIYHSFPPL